MELRSPAFADGSRIPNRFTCEGANSSPPLRWSGAPRESRTFALICDDPDAPRGTWLHWLLFNLPSDTVELEEGVPTDPDLPSGASQGVNDSRRSGYSGPCPPPGKAHRYFFRLYALDAKLALPKRNRAALETAMQGHILAEATLMGTYARRR